MKKTLIFLAFSLVFVACKTKKTTASNKRLQTHKEAIDTLRADAETIAPLVNIPLYPEQMRSIMDTSNFSGFFQQGEYSHPYDGFYGKDRYRIEMYYDTVYRDTLNHALYHIEGRSRFKNNIVPFRGNFTIQNVRKTYDPNMLVDKEIKVDSTAQRTFYTLEAQYSLEEDGTFIGSGQYDGKLLVDYSYYPYDNFRPNLWYFSPETPSKASGFLWNGTWTSYVTKKSKPALWSADIYSYGNTILKDFAMGERDVEINEKYRHLGWDKYWENNEWWTSAQNKTHQ
jgi:hypothetical protein